MLKSVLCSSGALAVLFAGSALAQVAGGASPAIAATPSLGATPSIGATPSANIGATIGSDAQIGAVGPLGSSVTGSPITPGSALPVNPSAVGSLAPSASTTTSANAGLQSRPGMTQPATAGSMGVSASASAPLNSPLANPVAVGGIVKSQSGAQMATIARLVPGADGYVSGVVLRTPSGALREAPLSALGLSGGGLVTTYNAAQINALPEATTGP